MTIMGEKNQVSLQYVAFFKTILNYSAIKSGLHILMLMDEVFSNEGLGHKPFKCRRNVHFNLIVRFMS